jgi:hypothetical protein
VQGYGKPKLQYTVIGAAKGSGTIKVASGGVAFAGAAYSEATGKVILAFDEYDPGTASVPTSSDEAYRILGLDNTSPSRMASPGYPASPVAPPLSSSPVLGVTGIRPDEPIGWYTSSFYKVLGRRTGFHTRDHRSLSLPEGAYHQVGGQGAPIYGEREMTEVPAMYSAKFLQNRDKRVFLLMPSPEFASLDATLNAGSIPHSVVDASSPDFLLLSNRPGDKQQDANPLKGNVWRAPRTPEPVLRPSTTESASGKYDWFGQQPPWKWRVPTSCTFSDAFELVGADFPAAVRGPSTIPVTLYFRVNKRLLNNNYRLFVNLDTPGGPRLFSGHFPVNGAYPIYDWSPGEYLRDSYDVDVPTTTPAGTYTLSVGFWPGGEGKRLPITSCAGASDGSDRARLGVVEISPPSSAPVRKATGIEPGESIGWYKTSGHEGLKREGAAIYGQREMTEVPDEQAAKLLLNSDKRVFLLVPSREFASLGGTLNAARIPHFVVDVNSSGLLLLSNRLGDKQHDANPLKEKVWRTARTPEPVLEPGATDSVSGKYNWFGQQPPWKWRVSTSCIFGDAFELVGADFPAAVRRPGTIPVSLYFRVNKKLAGNYWRIFVHADAPGWPRLSVDSFPLNWAFPTNLWSPGEYIRDVYEVNVPAPTPPETYTLSVSFYSGAEDKNLKITSCASASDGHDRARLGVVDIR